MLNPSADFIGTKLRVKFNGDRLKQENITFNYGKIVNIYIVYEIERSVDISSYPTLENSFLYIRHLQVFNEKEWNSIKSVSVFKANICFSNDVFWL